MFGDGEGPIVYSNMMCEGFERNLADCNKNMYPNIVCSRKNVVGVLCKDGMLYSNNYKILESSFVD